MDMTEWMKMDENNRPVPVWGADPWYWKGLYDQHLISANQLMEHVPFITNTTNVTEENTEPVIGHRADTVMIDDVTTPPLDSLSLYDLKKWYRETMPQANGKSRLIGEYTIKLGEEMEIGGNKCHLCGAEILYADSSSTYLKKKVVTEKHMVYQCGTQILETKKAKYIDPSNPYVADGGRPDRHIHAECI